MDRKLLDYLPPVLREVMEMRTINGANEPEVDQAWDALTLVLANQFLETADIRGVSIWEKELKILPKNTDTLEMRKARIKAMWNRDLPYTFAWLKNWLDGLCGTKGHRESVNDYALDIELDYDALPDTDASVKEITGLLAAAIPANMRLRMTAVANGTARVWAAAAAAGEELVDGIITECI